MSAAFRHTSLRSKITQERQSHQQREVPHHIREGKQAKDAADAIVRGIKISTPTRTKTSAGTRNQVVGD